MNRINNNPQGSESTSTIQNFSTFIKEQIGTLGGIAASLPIITDYFQLIKAPAHSKSISLVTSVLCIVIFLCILYTRNLPCKYDFLKPFLGIFLAIVGSSLLIYYSSLNSSIPYYFAGFSCLVFGISMVVIYGFTREAERMLSIQQSLPKLDPEQWIFLQDMAIALASITQFMNSKISKQGKLVLKKITGYFYEENQRIFNSIGRMIDPEIHVIGPGPAMNRVYGYLMEATQKSFYALSCDDLEFWKSDQSSGYRHHNKLLAETKKDVTVERIFIVSETTKKELRENLDILKKQVEQGIKVGVAYVHEVEDIVPELDFAVFDDFGVSFWRGQKGPSFRDFRVKIDPDTCKRYYGYYNNVKNRCITKENNKPTLIDKQNKDRQIDELKKILT